MVALLEFWGFFPFGRPPFLGHFQFRAHFPLVNAQKGSQGETPLKPPFGTHPFGGSPRSSFQIFWLMSWPVRAWETRRQKSLIFADFRLTLEIKGLGSRRFLAENIRYSWETTGRRRFLAATASSHLLSTFGPLLPILRNTFSVSIRIPPKKCDTYLALWFPQTYLCDLPFCNRSCDSRRARFQTAELSAFFGPHRVLGSASFQPIKCAPKRTHRFFRRTHRPR